jgi:trans-aconitate methyltransferase
MAVGEAWRDRAVATRFATERAAIVPESRAQIDVLLHVLRHRTRAVERVVDLGCGDAVLLDAVLRAFPHARGMALDYSETMRELAGKRLAPLRRRAQVAPVDLRDAGWTATLDGPVDVVVSGFAIHHLPDRRKRALYAEIFERLALGGTFLDLEHVASATPGVGALHDEAMVRFQAAARTAAGERVALDAVRATYHARPDKADNILAPVDVQCAWLREIGFVDVDVFWKWFELALFGGQKPCS